MNRNVESHFALNPTNIDMSRSSFDLSFDHKTTFNVGEIIPIMKPLEVLPGDTFKLTSSKVVRLQTLLTPIMSNIFLDCYYFFVPMRLVWSHFKQFMGESERAWTPAVEYTIPQLKAPATTGWTKGTIADYFGVPTGVPDLEVNALPFRAFALVMSEWFRDENLQDPLVVPVTDATVVGVNTGNYLTDVAKGGLPFKAAKYHDYFTSALPAPQKGPDVMLPIVDAKFPVYPLSEMVPDRADQSYYQMAFRAAGTGNKQNPQYVKTDASSSNYTMRLNASSPGTSNPIPANLWALGSESAAASINALRMAFQIQKAYEKDARGGSRYIEIIKNHFGVTSPDARQQRPEYLGGNRIPININQVVQNSESGTTPMGTTTAYSVTTDRNEDFTKSFTENGYVIGVAVARYDHTYQQGLDRLWSRKTRFDFYWPVFANIGEQAIKNKEIYCQGPAAINPSTNVAYDDEVFGYQEAWADYRYQNNYVSGEMRSNVQTSLDVWHLADDYSQLPALSSAWIQEDKSNVDRVLAVTSQVSNQFFGDFYFRINATRPMPLYSIPGLIDHH